MLLTIFQDVSFLGLKHIKVPKTTRFSELFFCFNAKKLEFNFCIIPYSHPTHILTHNRTSAYGQSSTKQCSVTPKSENRCNFENKYLKAKSLPGEVSITQWSRNLPRKGFLCYFVLLVTVYRYDFIPIGAVWIVNCFYMISGLLLLFSWNWFYVLPGMRWGWYQSGP